MEDKVLLGLDITTAKSLVDGPLRVCTPWLALQRQVAKLMTGTIGIKYTM